jgi:hypothetical protein
VGLLVCRRGADQQALQGVLDGYRAAKSKVVVYEWCEGGAAVYGGEEDEEDEEEEEGGEGAVKRPELPQFLADLWGGKMVEVSISQTSLLLVLTVFLLVQNTVRGTCFRHRCELTASFGPFSGVVGGRCIS